MEEGIRRCPLTPYTLLTFHEESTGKAHGRLVRAAPCTLILKQCFRVHRNTPLSLKILKIFLGRRHSLLPRPHSQREGAPLAPRPSHFRRSTLAPPLSKMLNTPLYALLSCEIFGRRLLAVVTDVRRCCFSEA